MNIDNYRIHCNGVNEIIKLNNKKNFCILKIVEKNNLSENEYMLHRELSMLSSLIVKIHGRFYDKKTNKYIFVLDCATSDIFDFIMKYDIFDKDDICYLFYIMCLAVKILHDNNIAHLDIKLENFLFFPEQNQPVKICDFGHSLKLLSKNSLASISDCGTFYYKAPELYKNKYCNPFIADIWSLGVTFHVLLTQSWPYHGNSYTEVNNNVRNNNVYISQKHICEKYGYNCYSLLIKMLELDPKNRYTIDQILLDSYFDSVRNYI